VTDATLRQDAHMMETAAAQCLLLAGFFRRADAASPQHPLGTRASAPASFSRAALQEASPHKAQLLSALVPGASSRGENVTRASAGSCATRPYLLKSTPSLM